MTKNPIINALAGLLYIVLVVSVLFNAQFFMGQEESILIPIAMLSLFVFSAASMAYIFLYEPLQLFLEGKKKESVNLFLKTLFAFAASAFALIAIGLSFQAWVTGF